MSDFYMAGFSQVFLNAALSLLFDYGDTMIRKAVFTRTELLSFPKHGRLHWTSGGRQKLFVRFQGEK